MKLLLSLIASLAMISAASLPKIKNVDVLIPRLNDERIVGGEKVNIAQYPHQVTLRYKPIFNPDTAYYHLCGGSIYSERIVITAAHCVIAKIPSQFHVVVGTSNRRGNDGIMVPVIEIIMHEDFNPKNFDNDIAIMVLGSSLPLNGYTIRPIELYEHELSVGTRCTITGWGNTYEKGDEAVELQAVHVPIISKELCSSDYPGRITDSMLCAGLRGVGGKDACQGDSGGPMIVVDRNNKHKLAGIISWGRGCARPEFPGVFSKISYLRPWLLKHVEKINSSLSSN